MNILEQAKEQCYAGRTTDKAPALGASESPVCSIISRCELSTDELYERIEYLRDSLEKVLNPESPICESTKQVQELSAVSPLAYRLIDHDLKLRRCIRMLEDIKERLAV